MGEYVIDRPSVKAVPECGRWHTIQFSPRSICPGVCGSFQAAMAVSRELTKERLESLILIKNMVDGKYPRIQFNIP